MPTTRSSAPTRPSGFLWVVVLGAAALLGCADSPPATADGAAAPDALVAADDLAGVQDADLSDGPAETLDTALDDAVSQDDGPPKLDSDRRFFDPARVIEVAITMAPSDWDTLRLQTRSLDDILGGANCLDGPVPNPFTYFPADVVVDGYEVNNVGVRKKGFLGSLDATWPSIKIKLHEYDDSQDLGGLHRLTLNNAKQDPSKLNQCLSYPLYTAAGVPAPRCSYAHLTVNGADMGLYVHVESIKKDFVRRHFAYEDGNLYEGALSDFREGWMATFVQKTNAADAAKADLKAVQSAAEAPDSELLERLGEVIDLDEFYSFWAIEVLTNHSDGYASNTNNFYVYRDLDGRFKFIPWGADNTFYLPAPGPGAVASVMATGVVARRLYLHPQGRAAYLARLQELLDTVWDEAGLLAEIDRQETLTAPYVLPDQRDQMKQAVETKRVFVNAQRGRIAAELSPSPPAWNAPLREPPCFVERGSVDMSFETTWGTVDEDNVFATGTAISDVVVDQTPWPMLLGGAKAGVDPNKPGSGTIVIAGQLDPATTPGGFFVAIVVMPLGAVQPGVFPIDWASSFGQALHLAQGATEPTSLGWLLGGTLTLEAAGTQPGSPLMGHLMAPIIMVGGN